MVYCGEKLKEISFPLGGIGTGCIGLAGNGALIDWEIFNRPNKGYDNPYSFFSVKAQYADGRVDVRVLQGDWQKEFVGKYMQKYYNGYGYGPAAETMCALPHFAHVEFDGRFPIAQVTFRDDTFPADVVLTAFNPFIPLNADDSGIPAAFFDIEVRSRCDDVRYTVALTATSPFAAGTNQKFANAYTCGVCMRYAGKDITDKDYAEMAIATLPNDTFAQEYWYRGMWRDGVTTFWHELATDTLTDRHYDVPGKGDGCAVCAAAQVNSGAQQNFRFAVAWYAPNQYNYWSPWKNEAGEDITWKNYYATQFEGCAAVAEYAFANWQRLYEDTCTFRDVLHGATLDPVVIEAVSSTMSVLKSPTVLRLEDGTFYGWEGVHEKAGSCEGTCTHVWSYAYALCFLFPQLERSLRHTELYNDTEPSGRMKFRTALPLGRPEIEVPMPACVDGQMASIFKMYREWQICGDTQWLRDNWPQVKKLLAYAWSSENPGAWDADHDGVMEGRQHHTLDMELFGPSSWLQGMYLAALKAAEKMAAALGDTEAQQEYAALFANGYAWTRDNLFNGSYFVQQVDLTAKEYTERFACPEYWNEEKGQLKYQIDQGSEIDQLLGQWHANVCGLGDIFDPEQRRAALKSMYTLNFKPSLRGFANFWRVFALNDEAGAVMCAYPDGVEKPIIPVPYCEECMTGFEYAFAGLLVSEGFVEEGLNVVRAIRNRYDGEKRNPWNEIECGNNYARPMASFALLPIFSGFEFAAPQRFIGFTPIEKGNFRCLWSLQSGWGEFVQQAQRSTVAVKSGSLALAQLKLGNMLHVSALYCDGEAIPFTRTGDTLYFDEVTVTRQMVAEA